MRNIKYIVSIAVILLLLGVLVAGCTTPTPTTAPTTSPTTKPVTEEKKTITIIDQRGKTLTIPYPCTRVVFLVENAMNTMYAVGGADNIVGIGQNYGEPKESFFSAIDKNWSSKTRMTYTSGQLSLETLAQANPQLVVLWSANQNDTNTKAIEETLKIPVYGAYIDNLTDVYKQSEDFSKIIGKEENSKALSNKMSAEIKKITDVTDKVPESEKPTVFWMWGDVYGTGGLNSTANDLIVMSGGVNVVSKWDNQSKYLEHPVLSMESIAALDPDVIYMWYNTKLDPKDIMTGEDYKNWRNLKAVKNGRVYEIESPFVYDFHCPRLPLAMLSVAKNLYPEQFSNVNMTEEADDYFVSVYGVHYPGFAKA